MLKNKGVIADNNMEQLYLSFGEYNDKMLEYYEKSDGFETYAYGVVKFIFIKFIDSEKTIIARYNSSTEVYEEFKEVSEVKIDMIRKRARNLFIQLEKLK